MAKKQKTVAEEWVKDFTLRFREYPIRYLGTEPDKVNMVSVELPAGYLGSVDKLLARIRKHHPGMLVEGTICVSKFPKSDDA